MTDDRRRDILDLVDYRRRVADLYHDVRHEPSPCAARGGWVRGRDELFATHRESPIPERERRTFDGLAYFPHDPSYRLVARLEPVTAETFEIGHSAAGTTTGTRCGVARFRLHGQEQQLDTYWLEQYGGGLFLPFRDATSGTETYGGGRYLLDTAKSADLGTTDDGALVLDFNFAFHPSCVHDPIWSCPLAPPENHLGVPVRAGERVRPAD